MAQPTRCGWAGPEPIYLDYHDHEWGRPTHDDRALFELLSLEGMQAGLSWITILKKRKAFRAAFADFEPAAVARFDEAKVAELMQNAGIALSRDRILDSVWRYDYYGDARTVDTHIKKLRQKLGDCGNYIKTIRGIGYKFDTEK